MSGNSIFLDTNILIYLLKGNIEIAQLLKGREFVVSFITELELLSFPTAEEEGRKISELLSECFIVDINREIKTIVPKLRMNNKLKIPDAIVCASSIFLNLPFFTADKHLAKVEEANVLFYEL